MQKTVEIAEQCQANQRTTIRRQLVRYRISGNFVKENFAVSMIMTNFHKLNAFLGARVLYLLPRKPSAMMTMLIHKASVLTDVFYVGIHFCIKHSGVPFLFRKLGSVASYFAILQYT